MSTGLAIGAPQVSGTTLLWYSTRATGIVALVLLTGTVMLGVVGTARAASQRWPRVVTAGLHRNLALTSAALIGVHVLTTVLDPFASISLVAAFLPFSSAYRPLWLSLGTVAFDLLLAVLITSLLRDRLSHRAWQLVHMLVYVSWPIALWHGLGTGTDTRLPWILAIDVACVAGVAWAVWWRLRLTESQVTRMAGLLTLAIVPLFTLIFVFLGPLQPGWAVRAGTPTALLGSHYSPAASNGTGGGTTRPGGSSGTGGGGNGGGSLPARLVNASFTGHLSVKNGPGANQRTITITGRTTTQPSANILIVLQGHPAGSGVSLTGGTVRIGPPSGAYTGPVTALAGKRLIASVSGSGVRRTATFTLTIHGPAVTGTVSLAGDSGE